MKEDLVKNRWMKNPFLEEASYKKSFFWNMMGSGLNAFASLVMLMATTRIAGEIQGGIFSIGFAIASLMWSLASYETNTFHVTDGKHEFSNENFLHVKLLLCIVTVGVSVVYILFQQYDSYKSCVAFLLCMYKIIDAFSGLFYGLFQKSMRLDISGRSYFLRVFLSIIGFCITLWITKDLVWAVLAACILEVLWIAIYEIPLSKFVINYRMRVEWKKIGSILIKCFPLFCASFLLMYVNNIPKYTIDNVLNEQMQNAFGIIFMPASIINLMGIFVFRPLLMTLVRSWNENKINRIVSILLKCIFLVVVITAVCAIGAFWIGIPVLQLIYGVELTAYKTALVIIMIAGGSNAAISFLYNVLVVTRKQVLILVAYIPAVIIALMIAEELVTKYALVGAAIVYFVSVNVIVIILFIMVMVILKSRKRMIT